MWWRQIIPDPEALLVVYAVGWVVALALNGLYRPRARWSIRTEAWDLLRATALMAVATFAVLFWFKLPDVSRLFLILLFPTQYVVTLVTRAILRLAFRELRARGMNARYVLVVGAGPRGQAFADDDREPPRAGAGSSASSTTTPTTPRAPSGPGWARWPTLEQVMADNVIDEVAICLPFSQWQYVDGIAYIAEEAGKIVRVPMDVLDHPFAPGQGRGPRWHAGLLARVRARIGRWRWSIKRVFDIFVAAVGPGRAVAALRGSWAGPSGATADRRSSARRGSACTAGRSRSSSSAPWRSMPRRAWPSWRTPTSCEGHVFKMTDDPRITPVGRDAAPLVAR